MKKDLLFVCMMVAMMAASVGLTSCSKSDDQAEKPADPAQTSLNGTWVNKSATNEVAVALTFDSGNSVVAFIEGKWFFCTANRTAGRMTLTGSQIRMEKFTDYGTFTATDLGVKATIVMDYELRNGMLIISNISISPNMGIGLLQTYGLTFDKVYMGESIIL